MYWIIHTAIEPDEWRVYHDSRTYGTERGEMDRLFNDWRRKIEYGNVEEIAVKMTTYDRHGEAMTVRLYADHDV